MSGVKPTIDVGPNEDRLEEESKTIDLDYQNLFRMSLDSKLDNPDEVDELKSNCILFIKDKKSAVHNISPQKIFSNIISKTNQSISPAKPTSNNAAVNYNNEDKPDDYDLLVNSDKPKKPNNNAQKASLTEVNKMQKSNNNIKKSMDDDEDLFLD